MSLAPEHAPTMARPSLLQRLEPHAPALLIAALALAGLALIPALSSWITLTVAGLAERAIVTGHTVVARLAVVTGLAVVARLAVVAFDLAVHGLARSGAWLHSQLLRDRGQHQPGPRAR